MKKKIIYALLMMITLFMISGCFNKSYIDNLEGNDLIAYKMMLEICYKAKNPSKVSVISGTVTDTIGVFKVIYDEEESYNILVSEENGNYVIEKLHDELAITYKDLLYNTDDFNIKNVNNALKEKWQK